MNLLRRGLDTRFDLMARGSAELRDDWDEQDERAFQDFVASISLSDEEMNALMAMPDSSVPEIRRLFDKR